MIATLLTWLGGKLAGPILAALAMLFALGLAWQSARIEGLPLLGGGFKAQVAALTQQLGARDLADARAQAAALTARQAQINAGEAAAKTHAVAQAATESQIQTVLKEVPVYVTPKAAAACVLPWGFVRLLDAAASGADPADVRARVAPGQSDDAASDVGLPEALALLAADLGAARQSASQLEQLEKAVAAP
jgi:hypothetical protein